MSTEHLLVQTADEDALRQVVSALGSRRVGVQSLAATRSQSPHATGYDIRISTDTTDLSAIELVVKRMNRIVSVVKTIHVTSADFHKRRAILVRLEADPETRSHLLDVSAAFGAEVIDMNSTSVTLGFLSQPHRVDDLLAMLANYPIIELTDSGVLALRRGRRRASKWTTAAKPRSHLPRSHS